MILPLPCRNSPICLLARLRAPQYEPWKGVLYCVLLAKVLRVSDWMSTTYRTEISAMLLNLSANTSAATYNKLVTKLLLDVQQLDQLDLLCACPEP